MDMENQNKEIALTDSGKEAAGHEQSKKMKKRYRSRWLYTGICVSLLLASLFTSLYGYFRKSAESLQEQPLENANTVAFLFQHSYLLYRDLYHKLHNTDVAFGELYLEPTEGNEWILEEDGAYETELAYGEYQTALEYLQDMMTNLEASFSQLNLYYDYLAEDLSGKSPDAVYTNLADTGLSFEDIDFDSQYFALSFTFDEHGNVTVGTAVGKDPTLIRKYANEASRSALLENRIQSLFEESEKKAFRVTGPRNFRVTYCIAKEDWETMQKENFRMGNHMWSRYSNQYEAYRSAGTGNYFLVFLLLAVLLAFLLPYKKTVSEASAHKIWSFSNALMPLEAALLLLIFGISFFVSAVTELVIFVAGGGLTETLSRFIPGYGAGAAACLLNIIAVTAIFFGAWYLGVCFRPLREIGFCGYLKKYSLIYRFFPFAKRKLREFFEALSHFDVTRDAKRIIFRIVIINAILLFVISSLWVGGFLVAAIYSVILYFVLRKYINNIQKKYSILLNYINKIAEGNLNVNMVDDLGVFNPLKPQLIRIQRGFRTAVEEEVKSSRMKSELITNVSHDLKTPLTAIITYINLLKDENLTKEQRREYLRTLERKSLRLKVLIEDLFEVSKASTGNVTLNLVKVDVMNLVKQVALELSDKIEEAGLDMRINLSEEKAFLMLDSQKTYRIYENLIGNIAKYAMPGTRVYINGFCTDDRVVITLKNITAQEISLSPEELTERFMRGDASRNTEGSGLGLAIAKSFAELQNGSLDIEIDGDLFKVTTIWRLEGDISG